MAAFALVLALLLGSASALCNLTGHWTGVSGQKALYDNYYIEQTGNTLAVWLSANVAARSRWRAVCAKECKLCVYMCGL